MSKIALRNGREVDIKPLPLDESGDELAGLIASIGTVQTDLELRALYRTIGLKACSLFAPGLDPAAVLAGLDMGNVQAIIKALNGLGD
jgi:hypothetical protein